MDNPLVSIITITYNHQKYIEKCIESVLSQKYVNWEQIIIDDGSSDRTEDIIKKFIEESKDPRIKYFKQENKGIWNLKNTYNNALRNCKGELIAILEGDDFWPPKKLEHQIKAFNDPEVVLCWGWAGVATSKNQISGLIPPKRDVKHYNSPKKEDNLKKLLYDNFIPACTVICRKNALENINGFKQPPDAPYVDYFTWLWLSVQGKFLALDEVLGYWRKHETQVSSNNLMEMVQAEMYSVQFASKLPQKLLKSSDINLDDIKKKKKEKIGAAFFFLARKDFSAKDWGGSKIKLKNALEKGSFLTKMKSMCFLPLVYLLDKFH